VIATGIANSGSNLIGVGFVSGISTALGYGRLKRGLRITLQPSETNVLGASQPSKVVIASIAIATGDFTPALKPVRVQWRT
jgi:hypothetical protein